MPAIGLPGGPRRRWVWGLGAGVLVAAVVAAVVVASGPGNPPGAKPRSRRRLSADQW